MWIDAHCHSSPKEVKQALEKNISYCFLASTGPADWQQYLQAQLEFGSNKIGLALGVHPWFVNDLPSSWENDLENLLMENSQAWVGECGLDFWADPPQRPERKLQIEIFEKQLELAEKWQRGIVLHCVKSGNEILSSLKKRSLKKFILHSWSGSAEMAREYAKLGASFSVSASLLRVSPSRAQKILTGIPKDRLLLETDAPDMHPERDKHNLPEYLPLWAERIAALMSWDVKDIKKQTTENARSLFEI